MITDEIANKEESGPSRFRQYTGPMAVVVKIFAGFLPLYSMSFSLNIYGIYFHILFSTAQFVAIFLFFTLALNFSLFPATKKAPRNHLPWYDFLLIILSLPPILDFCLVYPSIAEGVKTQATPIEQVWFVVLVLLIFEALRRALGWAVVLVGVFFLIYTKFAYLLPGLWGTPFFTLERLANFIYLNEGGIFGMIMKIGATIIILFVTFGELLKGTGLSDLLMNVSFALAGKYRGGVAKVSIIASALFGTMSGSPTSNVGTIGVITIPLMKKIGYRDYFAGGVEAVASTGGYIMPPVMGPVAFVMAEMTGAGYLAVCLAAAIPAILYYLCLFFQLDFEAAKLGLIGLPREQLPSARENLKRGWYLLLPIFLLVTLLAVIRVNPLTAVLYVLPCIIALGWFRKGTRMGPKKIFNSLAAASMTVLPVLTACALAGIIMGSLGLTGLGINVGALFRQLSGGNIFLLAILCWIFAYISGMAMAELIIYIVMAIIMVPNFISLGIPTLVAHMFILYIATSMFITPPVAPAVYVSCGIAGSGLWQTGFAAMRLGIVTFLIPFTLLLNPALCLVGSPWEIGIAFLTAICGSFFLASGIEGYLLRRTNLWERMLFILGGGLLFIPGAKTDLLGVLMVIIGLSIHLRGRWGTKAKVDASNPLESSKRTKF